MILLNYHRLNSYLPPEWGGDPSRMFRAADVDGDLEIENAWDLLGIVFSILALCFGTFRTLLDRPCIQFNESYSSLYDCQWVIFGIIISTLILWNLIFLEIQRRQSSRWVKELIGEQAHDTSRIGFGLRFVSNLNVNLAICTISLCELMLLLWGFIQSKSIIAVGQFFTITDTAWLSQAVGVSLIFSILLLVRVCQIYARNEFVYLCYFLFVFTLLIFFCTDWISFIIANEGIAFTLYIFAILQDSRKISVNIVKVGEKYILFGIFASGLLTFGVSLLYASTGLIIFDWKPLWIFGFFETNTVFVVGALLFTVGWFFKVSIVPLHAWIVPVYTYTNDLVVFLFAIYTKTVFVLILVVKFPMFLASTQIQWWLFVCSIGSMIVGTLGALSQVNIKGLLAYSAISNIGLVGLILSYNTSQSVWLAIGYIVCYALTVTNTFITLYGFRNQFDSSTFVRTTYEYQQAMLLSPFAAFCLALAFVGLMGLPPFVLFVFKVLAIFVAVNYWVFLILSSFIVIISVLGVIYYVRLLREIFFYNDVVFETVVERLMFNWSAHSTGNANLVSIMLSFVLVGLTPVIFVLFGS